MLVYEIVTQKRKGDLREFYSRIMNILKKRLYLILFLLVGVVSLVKPETAQAAEFNIFEKSGYSIEQFNQMLVGTNLENCGAAFHAMENKHNINGVYAISVAALESGFESRKINSSNNLFGMMSKGKLIKYSDIDSNVNSFGKLMNKSIYKGKSISKIAKTYCPPNSTKWVNVVTSKYQHFVDKI